MPNDNDYIKIGASGDLALVHNGSASYVQNSTGFLQIQSDGITFDNASGTERARIDSSGNFLVGGTSLGAADSFGVQPSGHFRHIGASGSTGDTLLGAIDGVSNGFQVNISGTNVQKYKFHNGSTQTVQIDSDGLKFMNDTAAANALDDYEYGTFTPTSNATLTSAAGSYTKIGRQVTVHVRIQTDSSGSGTQMILSNLPFSASMPSGLSNGSVPNGFGYISGSVYNGGVQLHMVGSGTNCYFFNFGTSLTIANLASRDMRFGFVYHTAG